MIRNKHNHDSTLNTENQNVMNLQRLQRRNRRLLRWHDEVFVHPGNILQ